MRTLTTMMIVKDPNTGDHLRYEYIVAQLLSTLCLIISWRTDREKQPDRPSASYPSEILTHVPNLNEKPHQDRLLNRIAQNVCKKSYRQQDKHKQAEQQDYNTHSRIPPMCEGQISMS
jgi:hypothetical protein